MFKGKAIYWNGSGRIKKGNLAIDKVNDDEAVIRVAYCGICGSDLSILKGKHPRAKPPLILGHEFSGIVEYLNENIDFKIGDHVVVNPLIPCHKCDACEIGKTNICHNLKLIGIDCNGAFSEYVLVKKSNLIKINNNLDLRLAALSEPFATAVHTFSKTEPKDKNELILILGGGPIGTAVALYFCYMGYKKIFISEVNKSRLKILKEMGFITINPLKEDLFDFVNRKTEGKLADIVIEATGCKNPISKMAGLSRIDGKVMVVGVSHEPRKVDLLNVNFKELTLYGVRNYTQADFKKGMDFIFKNKENIKKIITHEYRLEEFKKAIGILNDRDTSAMKFLVKVFNN